MRPSAALLAVLAPPLPFGAAGARAGEAGVPAVSEATRPRPVKSAQASPGARAGAEDTRARVPARSLQAAARFDDAAAALERAHKLMLGEVGALLTGETIVYSRNFASVAEEFEYALERNRSYETLIPVAIAQFRPRREALVQIDRDVERSRLIAATARQQAAQRSVRGAIASVQGATEGLQRALRAAGLEIPQHMGSQ